MYEVVILWSSTDLHPSGCQKVSCRAVVTLSKLLANWGQPSKGRAFSWPAASPASRGPPSTGTAFP